MTRPVDRFPFKIDVEISIDTGEEKRWVPLTMGVVTGSSQSCVPKSFVDEHFPGTHIWATDRDGDQFKYYGMKTEGALDVTVRYDDMETRLWPLELLVIDSDNAPPCFGMDLIHAFGGGITFGGGGFRITSTPEIVSNELFCLHCYTPGPTKRCAKCRRSYCSRQCQVSDWTVGSHKHWCGKAGEFGVDFEFREVRRKPAVFALRDFKRGEVVIVESPKMMVRGCRKDGDISGYAYAISHGMDRVLALQAEQEGHSYDYIERMLFPKDFKKTREDKIKHNLFFWNNDSACILPMTSYINARCPIGTAILVPQPKQGVGVMLVKCIRDIPAGGQVTISLDDILQYQFDQQTKLKHLYLTNCKCIACEDLPSVLKEPIDDVAYSSPGVLFISMRMARDELKWDSVLCYGMELVDTYDGKEGVSPKDYCRTFYMMFQAKLHLERFPDECVKYAEKALQHAAFYCEEDSAIIQSLRAVVEDPLRYFEPLVNEGLKEIMRDVDSRPLPR